MADTSKNRNRSPKGYSTLPIRYFAKCLGISESSANNYKKLAQSSGWIIVKRQITIIKDLKGKPLNKDLLFFAKSVINEDAGKLRVGSKFLKKVDCDLIKSNVICARKCFKNGEKI
jgi:hypothetical protein